MRSILCILAVFLPLFASAQTGVNDDRVSLPEGPGSLEGVGDNASVTGNMGAMTYSVAIEVAKGFPDVTPALSLDYNSMGGNSVVGMGFSLAQPFVERLTNRGLPTYDDDDVFVFGGAELVRVDAGEPAMFRARFETGFARYFWHDRDAPSGGWWRVEQPNGVVQWFGADPQRRVVPSARLDGAAGVFRWHLVEAQDRFGHRMRATYAVLDDLPYLERLDYIFTDGPDPHAAVTFEYARREDPISDARSGAEEVLAWRLTGLTAWAEGVQFRRYAVQYEPYAESGGLSRIERIEQFGHNDAPIPVAVSFGWSKALGGVCQDDCRDPQLVQMGAIGANPGAGNATLIDLNGDAVPDMVDTSQPGPHHIYLGRLHDDGGHDFAPVIESAVGTRAGHELASPYTQILDADGDGRADMVNVRTGEVLFNVGTGDWAEVGDLEAVASLPDFGEEFAVGAEELTHVRFMDYNNDRRIDVVRSSEVITQIYANQGADGFALDPDVEPIGAGFADQRLEFADLNGDGLLDPVILRPGALSWRANLGHGRWSQWRELEALPFNDAQLDQVELEDLNGDSLDDIVLVLADEVHYALNRGGERFDDVAVIDGTAEGALPQRVDGTTVLFADMNGSGSDDVVWITAAGAVTYLELFPLRPNLMTRIVDDYGVQTDVTYSTAAQLAARDPDAWTRTAPFAMAMVARLVTRDPLTGLAEVTEFDYLDGFYDTAEKQFRGFAEVEQRVAGDAVHAASRTVERFELGLDDPYFAGRLLESRRFAEGADVPLRIDRTAYADCDLDGIPADVSLPIRHVCKVSAEQVSLEGAPAAEHATTRTDYAYDAWGNVVRTTEHGVVAVGGGGCGACDPELRGRACGPDCLGDERYTETRFVPPANAGPWLTALPWRERRWSVPGTDDYAETLTYYDGAPFVGLPAGQATVGMPSRITERVDAQTTEPALRGRYDQHGNLVEEISPVADLADRAGFGMHTIFDAAGLDIITRTFEVRVDDEGDDNIYALQRDFTWDRVSGRMASSTDWYVVGQPAAPGIARYSYDAFARLTAIILPGDAVATPTTTFDYDFGGPISTITRRDRTTRNSRLPDRETVQCFDSAGRKFQERVLAGPGSYQVIGHTVYDVRGRVAVEYMDHLSGSRACAIEPPGVRSITHRHDALGRTARITLPDADEHGRDSVSRVEHRPQSRWSWDAEDTDPDSPHADTPTIRHVNGLGQVVALEQRLANGITAITDFGYDAVGRLVAARDAGGVLRSQVRDGRGRVTEFDDPDRGARFITRDAAGRVLRSEDAEGVAVRNAYDSLGRRVATWDEADPEATRATFRYDRVLECPEDVCIHTAEALVEARYPVAGVEVQAWHRYDDRRRLETRRLLIGDAQIETTTDYDNLGEVRAEHFPGGITLEYTRDARSRPVSVAGLVDGIEYTPFSEVAARRFANGVVEAHDFNGMRQAVRRLITGADGEPLVDLGYRYNRLGQLLEISDALAGQHAGPGLGARFGYDALYRLTSAELEPDNADRREVLTYRYAPDGRLLDRTSSRGPASPLHLGEYVYGERGAGPHAVTTVGPLSLDYDGAGRLVRRGDVDFTRDHSGRITGARRAEQALATFGYSPTGRRMWRGEGAHFAWELGAGLEIEDGMLLVHAMLGAQRLATIETDAVSVDFLPDAQADGRIDAADAIRADADETSLRRILSSSARRGTLEGEQRTTWYHYDHLFSVVAITDDAGTVVSRRGYAPYGSARHSESGAETPYSHVSKRTDRSTGLADHGMRHYDALLGRWVEPDPAFTEITADLAESPTELMDAYGYCLGNPVNAYDPDGGKADWGTAAKWGVKIGVVLGGSALGIVTGGMSNLAAAGVGAAGAFTGAVAREVAMYKFGNVEATGSAIALSALRVTLSTTGGFLAGGFLGIGWAGAEWARAAVGAGVAYKAARTRDANGQGTPATSKWDLAGVAVELVTPSIATPTVAIIGVASALYTFKRHAQRKRRKRAKHKARKAKRGLRAQDGARSNAQAVRNRAKSYRRRNTRPVKAYRPNKGGSRSGPQLAKP